MLVQSSLTVLFEEPFWIGLYERSYGGCYEVCKITFGAEPNEPEVYSFLLANWSGLQFASLDSDEANSCTKPPNPKRLQRQINKQMQQKTLSTKAQLVLQQQREENKLKSKADKRKNKAAEQERKFTLRQIKRKNKHKK